MTILVLQKIAMMFIILLLGVYCSKKHLIDHEMTVKLSTFLLQVINPVVIFVSYQLTYDADLLHNLFVTMALAAVGFALHILAARLLIRQKNRPEYATERLSAVYGNCGFIGIPLANGLFGREGVFYMTAYLTIFHLYFWTHGVILMCGRTDRKEVVKSLLSPAIIGVLLGLVCFLARIRVHATALEALELVGNMNTPLAMLVAGATLAESRIGDVFAQKGTYFISALKLLLMPAVMMALLWFFDIPGMVKATLILASACPIGACCTMFALRFKGDGKYASLLFTASTVLAAVTIPLVIYLSELAGVL
ncbi:MAG: AEC family transporter [Lachnospiraceae bacterium]|nr:AEC family transporter [Lachnospiraceae bacterium]